MKFREGESTAPAVVARRYDAGISSLFHEAGPFQRVPTQPRRSRRRRAPRNFVPGPLASPVPGGIDLLRRLTEAGRDARLVDVRENIIDHAAKDRGLTVPPADERAERDGENIDKLRVGGLATRVVGLDEVFGDGRERAGDTRSFRRPEAGRAIARQSRQALRRAMASALPPDREVPPCR